MNKSFDVEALGVESCIGCPEMLALPDVPYTLGVGLRVQNSASLRESKVYGV